MYNRKKRLLSNRSHILECIFRNAPIARTEIADLTDITPATVTNTVAALIGDGILREVGEARPPIETSSGRNRILLDIVPDCACSIGVEFTEKALAACICDMKGNILFHMTEPFTEDLAKTITERIVAVVRQLMETSGLDWSRITGIGIALPGHISLDESALITNRTTWISFKPEQIRESFPVPVAMENNARCMALGEYLFHPAQIPDNFSLFHAGMGMFCANIVDGELFLGHHYVAGEIGHTIVNENGPLCECGKRGCLQTYASETRMVRAARILYANASNTLLQSLAPSREDVSIETLLTAYDLGDPTASSIVHDALKYLSISISNVAITMNPEKIFLHAQMFNHQNIREELMDHINRQLLFIGDPYTNSVEVLPFAITDGARGACALTIQKFFL